LTPVVSTRSESTGARSPIPAPAAPPREDDAAAVLLDADMLDKPTARPLTTFLKDRTRGAGLEA
jgi:hypothetical protein